MNDDSADDELIESELSSEDDFELKDVNALWNKKKTKHTNCEIIIFTTKFYVPFWYFFCPFTTFVHCWETYVWTCITVLVFVDYVPLFYIFLISCFL